jgi:hypothetical protein
MQASSSSSAQGVHKQWSNTQVIENLMHWPIRWWSAWSAWGTCEPAQAGSDYDNVPEVWGEPPQTRHPSASLPVGPKERSAARYKTSQEVPLHGEVIHRGRVLHQIDNALSEVILTVHAGSFIIEQSKTSPAGATPTGEGQTLVSKAFSPFSITDFAKAMGYTGPAEIWAPFKLSVVRVEGDSQYYFVSCGVDAVPQREKWISAMSTAIHNVTRSLFPPHDMDVRPLPSAPATTTRIMAGYLLRCEQADSLSLLYGELHAFFGGEAKLSLYKDVGCDQKVFSLSLTGNMEVHSCKGAGCCIFAVNGHLFAARTQDERMLWLRAAGNLKVKLLYGAPDPTREEIGGFRSAILERILELPRDEAEAGGDAKVKPLLPPTPRLALQSPRGDEWTPDLADDISEIAASAIHSREWSRRSRDKQQSHDRSHQCMPEAASEESLNCRLAHVVQLLDPDECREFLAPFDNKAENADHPQCDNLDVPEEGDVESLTTITTADAELTLGTSVTPVQTRGLQDFRPVDEPPQSVQFLGDCMRQRRPNAESGLCSSAHDPCPVAPKSQTRTPVSPPMLTRDTKSTFVYV